MAELVHALKLDAAHFQPAHAPPGVASFVTPDDHQVLIVMASSRVQLRVSLDVAHDARRLVAERVAASLVRAVADARARLAISPLGPMTSE